MGGSLGSATRRQFDACAGQRTRTREAHRQHDGQLAGGNPCWQQATKDVSRVNENKLLACE